MQLISCQVIRFILNGKQVSTAAGKETPLLWVLRDHLGLTGTKFGCGKGLCGACTVHVEDRAARSCQFPIAEIEGKSVTTIEGLSPDGTHPLQLSWIREQVPQCGYCQSGQIMSAAALLRENPQPTEQEIAAAMDGNLCRCGTYQRIRRAILAVAQGH